MPRFNYQAIDWMGNKVRANVDAITDQQALELLENQKLTVIELKQDTSARNADGSTKEKDLSPGLFQGHLSLTSLVALYDQLGFLVASGIPVYAAIQMLLETFKSNQLCKLLRRVLFDIKDGFSLSASLQKHPRSFPILHTHLIAVGEQSGDLEGALSHLTNLLEEQQEIKSGFIKAISYPLFLLSISIVLVVGLIFFIFPKFQSIFESYQVKLPQTTLILMAVTNALHAHLTEFALGVSFTVAAIVYFFRSDQTSEIRDRVLFALPFIKDVYVSMFIALLAKSLSNLLKSGVPLLDSLGICKQTIRGGLKQKFLDGMIVAVKEGELLSSVMQRTYFIPPLTQQLTSIGERTGNLDDMMERLFLFYKKRYSENLNMLNAILQPALMLGAALMITLVATALFIPLFKLSSGIRKH